MRRGVMILLNGFRVWGRFLVLIVGSGLRVEGEGSRVEESYRSFMNVYEGYMGLSSVPERPTYAFIIRVLTR